MWFNTPTVTAWGTNNLNVAVASITNIVCPSVFNVTSNTLNGLGLNPATALIGSTQANGCAVVSALPNSPSYVRVAYKLYFSVTASQWASLAPALATKIMVQYGHILCGSTIYFQTATGVNTMTAISSTNYPEVGNWCELPV